jgi:aconitase A
VPDQVTQEFIGSRKNPRNKTNSIYFRPDDDAQYSSTHEIDLSTVKPFIAKYPNPDDVVPVTEFEGTELDGCFIGACTTAEEDIILGALVLEQGLKMGKKPVSNGKRKVTPGSKPIINKLEQTGLADVYRNAGFEIGIPGCSYCVGMSADKAAEGDVWLSSQNRNFENRMGRGSIGNLASAATVAASSFDMKATDPTDLIQQIDMERWTNLRHYKSIEERSISITYVEPAGETEEVRDALEAELVEKPESEPLQTSSSAKIVGKVQRLGDMIDTDAVGHMFASLVCWLTIAQLAPAEYLITAHSNEAIGQHCLEYTNPKFRGKVEEGFNIVVAGKGFGCGSSRMEAVMALLGKHYSLFSSCSINAPSGCGVQCVIAESFAFIFSRNSPSLGLVTITITDSAFYKLATDGAKISVDLEANHLKVGGSTFGFEFSAMERQLMELGGITQAFHKHGKTLFQTMVQPSGAKVFNKSSKASAIPSDNRRSQLAW